MEGSNIENINWLLAQTVTPFLRGVCWSPELEIFVAVGFTSSNDRGAFYTSADGASWTLQQTLTSASNLFSVCWAKELGLLVAVGYDLFDNEYARIYSSPDGIVWTVRLSAAVLSGLKSVCWSPELSMFVACGNANVYTSANGLTWTRKTISMTGGHLESVCWVSELGLFILVGYSISTSGVRPNAGVFYSSSDGAAWTLMEALPYNTQTTLQSRVIGVCWSKELELLVAVGENSGGYGIWWTSKDGKKWTEQKRNTERWYLADIVWIEELNVFIGVGCDYMNLSGNGYTPVFSISPDGVTWDTLHGSECGLPFHYVVSSVCLSPKLKRLIAVGYNAGSSSAANLPDRGIIYISGMLDIKDPFVPVADLINAPTEACAGTPLVLTVTIIPPDATNQSITWSVKVAGTTGATIE